MYCAIVCARYLPRHVQRALDRPRAACDCLGDECRRVCVRHRVDARTDEHHAHGLSHEARGTVRSIREPAEILLDDVEIRREATV